MVMVPSAAARTGATEATSTRQMMASTRERRERIRKPPVGMRGRGRPLSRQCGRGYHIDRRRIRSSNSVVIAFVLDGGTENEESTDAGPRRTAPPERRIGPRRLRPDQARGRDALGPLRDTGA